jgi:hypothetical protein
MTDTSPELQNDPTCTAERTEELIGDVTRPSTLGPREDIYLVRDEGEEHINVSETSFFDSLLIYYHPSTRYVRIGQRRASFGIGSGVEASTGACCRRAYGVDEVS